jgi:hypothetical protein
MVVLCGDLSPSPLFSPGNMDKGVYRGEVLIH